MMITFRIAPSFAHPPKGTTKARPGKATKCLMFFS